MLNVLLYIHIGAALITAAFVTLQRQQELEAKGHLVLLAVMMVALALMVWPIMLWVAVNQYLHDGKRVR